MVLSEGESLQFSEQYLERLKEELKQTKNSYSKAALQRRIESQAAVVAHRRLIVQAKGANAPCYEP